MSDAREPIDAATVANELGAELAEAGGRDYLDSLYSKIPAIGNTKKYGRIVKDHATLRKLLAATHEIQESVQLKQAKPQELVELAYRKINECGEDTKQGIYSPDDLMDLAVKQLTTEPAERYSLGFRKLDAWTQGGLARGQVMVVASWPNTNKSCFVDQIAASMVKNSDRKACLYLSEMTVQERNARFIARHSKLTITEAVKGDLSPQQMDKMKGYKPPDIHVQPCAGWTVDEVCRDVLRQKWDIVIVDDIENLDLYSREGKQEAKAELSRRFNALAKDNQANCVLVMVSHLSRHAEKDKAPPRPREAHLRDSQMIAARADICCFLHREQDDQGAKLPETEVYFSRNRTGPAGESCFLDFDWRHVRLNEQIEEMKF